MQERRAHPRIEEEDHVHVKVLRAPAAPALEGHIFFCRTEDISEDGLRFSIPQAIPVGAVLELSVAFVKPDRAFRHTGRVAWIGQMEGNMTDIGVDITGTSDDQHVAWRKILAEKFGR